MLSDARIAEIAAVEAAAPKGPYTVGTSEAGALLVYIPGTAPLYIGDMAETVAADHALADFIADARQAVPELLADVAHLRGLLTLNWHGYYCAECGTSVPAACAECTAAGCYLHDLLTNRRGLPPVAGASVTPWHPPAAE